MSATSGGQGRQDPESLQRDAEAIREDMDRTLSALERRLSPSQMFDRALNYLQANGGDMLQRIGTHVRNNPVPILLTSAGLIWLAASSRESRMAGSGHRHSRWRGRVAEARSAIAEKGRELAGKAEHRGYEGTSRVHDVANRAAGRASRALDQTKHALDQTRQRTVEFGSSMSDMVKEQPLVFGAIALAIGAIVGAALPASEYERQLITRARTSRDTTGSRAVGGNLPSSGPSAGATPSTGTSQQPH